LRSDAGRPQSHLGALGVSALTEVPVSDRIAQQIDRHIKTGEHDPVFSAWPSPLSMLDRMKQGRRDLSDALLAEVRKRQTGIRTRALPRGFRPEKFSKSKLAPMVQGLLPKVERETVLEVLIRSVVFVHRRDIEKLLSELPFHGDAWHLANMYLYSIGAEPLDMRSAPHVGMGIHKTSCVSMLYFGKTGPFEDFVPHEAAHVFHNCKRQTVGLPAGRNREWILPIEFSKRELFAYSCEACGEIRELAKRPTDRKALLAEYAQGHVPSALGKYREEHLEILETAISVRNGWKVILEGCREPKRR